MGRHSSGPPHTRRMFFFGKIQAEMTMVQNNSPAGLCAAKTNSRAAGHGLCAAGILSRRVPRTEHERGGLGFLKKPPHNQGAFIALIELLVVVAIISLLVSILIPSLTRAKDLTKTAVCSANLKAWGTTLHMYVNDDENNRYSCRGNRLF